MFIDLGWWSVPGSGRETGGVLIWKELTGGDLGTGYQVVSLKICQIVRPWSNLNEANRGHYSAVRLSLMDDMGVWRRRDKAEQEIFGADIRKRHEGKAIQWSIENKSDVERKRGRVEPALTWVIALTPFLYPRVQRSYSGLYKADRWTNEGTESSIIRRYLSHTSTINSSLP